MTMDNDVDLIFLQASHVDLGLTGVGVPKRISEISVATMEPPQPSERAVLLSCLVRFS